MLDHEPSWRNDPHYKEGDRIFLASDPEGHALLGVKRMQSLYSHWSKSGNVGKLKTAAGKNAANIDAMLRVKGTTTRKPRTSTKGTGSGTSVGQAVKAKTVEGKTFEVSPHLVKEMQNQGYFLMWSRLSNSTPDSYSFGTLKAVSKEIIRYVSDLKIQTVDSVQSFLKDIAHKKILFVRPHESLAFLNAQLLMAAIERNDEELKHLCLDVLEPAVQYLKSRWEKEQEANKKRIEVARKDTNPNTVVVEPVTPVDTSAENLRQGMFEYADITEPMKPMPCIDVGDRSDTYKRPPRTVEELE